MVWRTRHEGGGTQARYVSCDCAYVDGVMVALICLSLAWLEQVVSGLSLMCAHAAKLCDNLGPRLLWVRATHDSKAASSDIAVAFSAFVTAVICSSG